MSAEIIPAGPARLPRLYAQSHDLGVRPLDDARHEIRAGVTVVTAFFIAFLGWAAAAPLDAAAFAQGKLVVSGQRQTVQHRDGGVVQAIAIHEGDKVRQGEVLITLAASDVLARERAYTAQAIDLLAQRARLQAEEAGLAVVAVPPELREMAQRDGAAVAEAIRLQQRQLYARRALLSTEQAVLSRRSIQGSAEASGYRRQSIAAAIQERLFTQELEDLKPAAAKGYVAGNRVRALERAQAAMSGDRARYDSAVAASHEASTEARLSMLGAERGHLDKVAADLRQVDAQINEVLPQLKAARDRLERTAIRAPATGTVVGLNVFTPGGVIAAGQRLMDIVPGHAPMRIEARVSTNDADDLLIGQNALVRFNTLHETTLAPMVGKLTRVSADSFVDERSGAAYYTAEVTVPDSELASLRRKVHRAIALRAGTPVQVQVQLRKRTALQYALEPLTAMVWRSFGEQ